MDHAVEAGVRGVSNVLPPTHAHGAPRSNTQPRAQGGWRQHGGLETTTRCARAACGGTSSPAAPVTCGSSSLSTIVATAPCPYPQSSRASPEDSGGDRPGAQRALALLAPPSSHAANTGSQPPAAYHGRPLSLLKTCLTAVLLTLALEGLEQHKLFTGSLTDVTDDPSSTLAPRDHDTRGRAPGGASPWPCARMLRVAPMDGSSQSSCCRCTLQSPQ